MSLLFAFTGDTTESVGLPNVYCNGVLILLPSFTFGTLSDVLCPKIRDADCVEGVVGTNAALETGPLNELVVIVGCISFSLGVVLNETESTDLLPSLILNVPIFCWAKASESKQKLLCIIKTIMKISTKNIK